MLLVCRHVSKYDYILSNVKTIKKILFDIKDGKIESKRHTIFNGASNKEKNSLKRRSGFGPVSSSKVVSRLGL